MATAGIILSHPQVYNAQIEIEEAVMMLAEFRVYVQVDGTSEETVLRMRDFIRACIENLDGVEAVEVEPSPSLLSAFEYPEAFTITKPTI
jgi:hypothetical protein